MDNFALEEKKNWKYNLEEYISSIKEYKYIDCNTSDYEYWYILEQLEKLLQINKQEKCKKRENEED